MLKVVKRQKRGVLSVLITSVIIFLLLVTGPTEAAMFYVSHSEIVEQGDQVEIKLEINLENEPLNFDNFYLNINGIDSWNNDYENNCKFSKDGQIIQGCEGITIVSQGNFSDYGYGYGYNLNEEFNYIIKINTNNFKGGKYSFNLDVKQNNNVIKEITEEFQVFLTKKTLEGCSIRAKNDNEKISFYIPKRNANLGDGSFIRDKSLGRLSYDFKVKGAIENNDSLAIFIVDGFVRQGKSRTELNNVQLIINKTTNSIKIGSESFSNWNQITFKNNCGF